MPNVSGNIACIDAGRKVSEILSAHKTYCYELFFQEGSEGHPRMIERCRCFRL